MKARENICSGWVIDRLPLWLVWLDDDDDV
jgi:hypothetical protein